MAASLDQKQVDELIEKYRALAEKEQRRVDELEERNEHLFDAIRSSLLVPASAFGLSYARAYYGESWSIFDISIDAVVAMLLKILATLLGFSSDNGAQVAAKVAHDVANGALASWSAAKGAELGLKKRLENPLPASQPNTGAAEMPPRSSRALTHEDLAAIKSAMALNTQPQMPQQPQLPVPAPVPPTAMPMANPVQQTMSPSPRIEIAAAPAPMPVSQTALPQHSPLNVPPPIVATAKIEPAPAAPSTPPKPFRFTRRWEVNPEADMRTLLQSVGAPADPNTVAHLLSHENAGDELRMILQRARAPA